MRKDNHRHHRFRRLTADLSDFSDFHTLLQIEQMYRGGFKAQNNYLLPSCLMKIYGDDYFMKLALQEAQKAAATGEVPVGAVITAGDQLLARCHNSTEMLNDVTAHAEILAITAAAQYLGSKYLMECTLYVTLEPCVMCAGALRWAQIGRVVYATPDDKAGFMRYGKELLHPRTQLEMGIMMEESSLLLKSFFAARRKSEP